MLNLSTVLESAARLRPSRVAIHHDGTDITYADLNDRATALAAALRARGLGRGERVVVICPNVPGFVIVYFAILKVGAVGVPLNPLLTQREIEFVLRDSDAV